MPVSYVPLFGVLIQLGARTGLGRANENSETPSGATQFPRPDERRGHGRSVQGSHDRAFRACQGGGSSSITASLSSFPASPEIFWIGVANEHATPAEWVPARGARNGERTTATSPKLPPWSHFASIPKKNGHRFHPLRHMRPTPSAGGHLGFPSRIAG